MKHNFAFAIGLVLVGTSSAWAQQPTDTVEIDPLVVTATRVARPISKVTSAVSVIDGAELRRQGIRNVAEALRAVSGAAVVQTGSYGANTSLFLRGGESDYVQVLIDGVQVNSPGEQFNFSTLAIEDIERIEVVKGPASVLYGSDAVTGVVQLFTKQRSGRPQGELRVSAGRGDKIGAQADGGFNNAYVSGEIAGGTRTARYSLGASHFGTQGAYAFNNEHRNTSVTLRGLTSAGARTELNGLLRYNASRYHVPTDGSGNLSDRNQFQDLSSLAVGLGALYRFSSSFSAQIDAQHNVNDATSDDQSDGPADTLGFFRFHSDDSFSRQVVDVRLNYGLGSSSTFTLGGELEHQSNSASSSSPFGDTPETTEKRGNKAVYAQWLADWSRLSLQLGVRGEDNDKFGSFGTYRGGLVYRVTPMLRVRASMGTAFKEPRFYEQFAQGFVIGNPDLSPEQSRSIEGGVDLVAGRATLSASYFDQKFDDLIQYIGMPIGSTEPNYVNVAGARASGLELGATLSLGRVQLNGNYTMLDTEVTDEGDGEDPSFAAGEELLRRPRHSGSLTATALFTRANVGATAHYVGERADLDFASFPASRVTLPAHTRVDLHGEYRVTNAVAGTLKVENLSDETYEDVLGFPAPGRVFYVGARLSIQ